MRSVTGPATSAMARSEKLHRLSTTLRQFGDYQIRRAQRLDGLDAGAVREFGQGNRDAAAWLDALADGAWRSGSPECIELHRLADLADDAMLIADDVSVRVDVRVRDGADAGPPQVAALQELCATAPATVGYLLGLILPESSAPSPSARETADLMSELRELEKRGLIGMEVDDAGELRCRPAAAAGDR